VTADREGQADSVPGGAARRQPEEARASSGAVRAYLLFLPSSAPEIRARAGSR
jgi:hypothetical protein